MKVLNSNAVARVFELAKEEGGEVGEGVAVRGNLREDERGERGIKMRKEKGRGRCHGVV